MHWHSAIAPLQPCYYVILATQLLVLVFISCSRQTMLVVMKADNPLAFNYLPGDHVAVYPSNRESIVEKLLEFVTDCKDFDQVLRLHRKDVAQEGLGIY